MLQLKNKFACLENLHDNVIKTLNNIQEYYCTTIKEVLGYIRNKEKRLDNWRHLE